MADAELSTREALVAADMIRGYFNRRIRDAMNRLEDAEQDLAQAQADNLANAGGDPLTEDQVRGALFDAEQARIAAGNGLWNGRPSDEARQAYDQAVANQEILRRYVRALGFPF